MRDQNLIVIVPAYNEETTIAESLTTLRALGDQLRKTGLSLKLYVVNDGSLDETLERARAAGADKVISHRSNRGLGAAVRTGLTAARHDGATIAVKFDADLQHDPVDVLRVIQPILNDDADVVYGDRFGQIDYRMPFMRYVGNKVFTALMRWLTGWPIRDSQPGIFALSRTYLEEFRIPGDYNYTQQVLLDAYHKGMRFAQVPVSFRKRMSGKSFVTLRYPIQVLWQIGMVLLFLKPMKIFGTLGGFFILFSVMIFAIQFAQFLLGYSERPVENVNLVLGTGLFGVQTLFFGALAQLIIATR